MINCKLSQLKQLYLLLDQIFLRWMLEIELEDVLLNVESKFRDGHLKFMKGILNLSKIIRPANCAISAKLNSALPIPVVLSTFVSTI